MNRVRLIVAATLLAAVAAVAQPGDPPVADSHARVTILYDAFGPPSAMRKDWGFSALIEYRGRRVLFDTGNDAEIFAHNAAVAGADLRRLDFAVISHRHLDHTAGLGHLLAVHPQVSIYAPAELAGMFGSQLPGGFYRRDESLPSHLRYFDDAPPARIALGTPWPGARFETIGARREVGPGMHVIPVVSTTPGTIEMPELALALETPAGLALIVGCSHPGIERIVAEARAIDPRVHLVLGGLHLPSASDAEITRIARAFHDSLGVERIAPGHCSGEPAFAILQRIWGDRYVQAGLGAVVELR